MVGTNQHIYFVDDRLGVLGLLKQQQPVTSLQWMGDHTVLVTTSSHLLHVYGEKHPQVGVVLSFADCVEQESGSETADMLIQPALVKALSDRVIFASKKLGAETQFISRPLFMLESILLGYLSTTS